MNKTTDDKTTPAVADRLDGVVMPLPLTEELRVEAKTIPNRKGQLYAIAADEIERHRSYLECDPTLTLCPRCGNDITKCARFFNKA